MTGTGDRADLDRLLAIEEIRQLAYRYAAAIEGRDVDAMAELYSPQARFGRWGDGPAGLRALMGDTMASSVMAVILVANHLVELDGPDRAHGQVWARCYAQNDPGGFVEQLIRYDDDYQRVDGRWRFRHRRHHLWFGTSVTPSPLDQDPAHWPASQVGVGDLLLSDPVFAAWRVNAG